MENSSAFNKVKTLAKFVIGALLYLLDTIYTQYLYIKTKDLIRYLTLKINKYKIMPKKTWYDIHQSFKVKVF